MARQAPASQSAQVGANIRHWRESRGMSQHDLAVLVDRTDSQVSRAELGKVAITVEQLFDYASALRIRPSALIR